MISYRPLILKVAVYVKQWITAMAAKPKIKPTIQSTIGRAIKIVKSNREMHRMARGL